MGSKPASSKPKRKRQQQIQSHHDAIQTPTRVCTAHPGREMTMNQLDLARHLTDAFSGSQRKDLELLERMREKYLWTNTSSATSDPIKPKPQKKTLQARKNDADWEARAVQGIKKKALSLDRQWNEKTWSNKSSCHERLKLLKDDGVDITLLQGTEISSETITRAILAQVSTREQRTAQYEPQPTVNDRTDTPDRVEEVTDASPRSPDPTIAHHVYHPLPASPLKRKRNSTCDTELPELPYSRQYIDDDEPAHKKQCTTDLRQGAETMVTEENISRWSQLRIHVLCTIFEPAKAYPVPKDGPSRISIAFPSQSAKVDVPGRFELNSKGYDNIMKELRVLGGRFEDNGKFKIESPYSWSGQHAIIITADVPRRMIIEGDTGTLICFLERLTTPGEGLAFMAKKCFDEDGVRLEENELFELSNATQKQLVKIKEELEARIKEGSVLVEVRCCL
jgi:hypothetical protein